MYVKFSSSGAFHLSEDAYTWSDAKAYCENRGSILASVHSQSEWEEILSIAKDVAHCQGDRCGGSSHSTCMWFWLGGKMESNHWVWIDGSAWNWEPSEPSSNQPAANAEDVCHSNYKNIARIGLTRTARKSLENQRSNTNSTMTRKLNSRFALEHRYFGQTEVRICRDGELEIQIVTMELVCRGTITKTFQNNKQFAETKMIFVPLRTNLGFVYGCV